MIVQTHVSLSETLIQYLDEMISSINRAHEHRNGSWNAFVFLVVLPAYSSIYLTMEDNGTENKMHIDIKCKQEKLAAASISTFFSTKFWRR